VRGIQCRLGCIHMLRGSPPCNRASGSVGSRALPVVHSRCSPVVALQAQHETAPRSSIVGQVLSLVGCGNRWFRQHRYELLQEEGVLTKAGLDFILHITNYFHGHWEDPEWGRMPVNQLLVGLAIRELADGIQDATIRSQIHTAANKAIAKNSQVATKG
jgi:hypothetical protein